MENRDKQGMPISQDDEFFDYDNVASYTECTGLIPTPPLSNEEAESYTDIYAIPQPENRQDNGLQHY